MATEISERIQQMRLDKMRQGQAVADFAEIPSLPEMRVALVPVTEADYDKSLELSAMIDAPENPSGWLRRERRANAETLVCAIRNPQDLQERVFEDVDELRDVLEVSDLNYLTDRYMEMVARSSPQLEAFSEDEMDAAKKFLQALDWNELSGRSWYALKRFLSSLGPTLRVDKLHGYSSTPFSTMTSERPESTPDA